MAKVYETLHISSQLADVESFPLVTDIQYLEPLTSKSLNRKFCGIARAGVYRGFACVPSGGMLLQIDNQSNQDGTPVNYGVALVERDDYLLTVRQQKSLSLTIPAGQVSYVVLEAFYQHGVTTSQVDIDSEIDAATVSVVTADKLQLHHVILCVLDVEAGATELLPAHINVDLRMTGGYDLDAHKGDENPHTQYVRRDADSTVHADIHFQDGHAAHFGTDKSLTIEHTNDLSVIDNSESDLHIRQLNEGGSIHIKATDTAATLVEAIVISGGDAPAVEVYQGGIKRLETTADGVQVTGALDASAEVSESGQRVYSPRNRNITDAVDNSSTTVYASAKATKTAYDRATEAESTALAYTDQRIAELLGEAPQEALDTLTELAEALNGADDSITAINAAIAERALKVTKVSVSGAITGGGTLGADMTIGVKTATTSQEGVTQLSNSVTSSSDDLAATASAVKQAYDLASTKLNATATAVNAALLDNLDSTQFLRSDAAAIKSAGHLTFADNIQAQFGSSAGIKVFHTGGTGYLQTSIGTLVLRALAGNNLVMQAEDADSTLHNIVSVLAGAVPYAALSYGAYTRLITTSAGIKVTGKVEASEFEGAFAGELTGNAATATKLATARTLTIGNKGKAFDGSANVAWSLDEIGAFPAAGGSLNVGRGAVYVEDNADDNLDGAGITLRASANPSSGSVGAAGSIFAVRSSGNALRLWVGQSVTSTGDNNFETKAITATSATINGQVVATEFVGALTGNADTATTLKTARTINGTSFNGSANITTATWGTARTFKIGDTSKSVNGSAAVTWTLDQIGVTHKDQTTQKTDSTGATILPVGTDAERPSDPYAGLMRFNSDNSEFEGHNGEEWGGIGGGGVLNYIEMTEDFTIERRKGYAIYMGDDVVKTITIPDGLSVGDWFSITVLEWTGAAGMHFFIETINDQWSPVAGLIDSTTRRLRVSNNATINLQKRSSGWAVVGGIGEGDNTVNFNDLVEYIDSGLAAKANPNLLINGDFSVWQRGASASYSSGLNYQCDRFVTYCQGAHSVERVVVKSPDRVCYGVKVTSNTYACSLSQRIERPAQFLGRTVTLSYWVYSETATTVTPRAEYVDDNSGSVLVWDERASAITVPAGVWVKVVQRFDVPEADESSLTHGASAYFNVNLTAGTVGTYTIADAKLELGSVATPFIADEPSVNLAKCQRYYQYSSSHHALLFSGDITSGNYYYGLELYPVKMRAVPTYSAEVVTSQGFDEASAVFDIFDDRARLRLTSSTTRASGFFRYALKLDAEL